jgi:glucose-6-phosphate isomerase
MIFDPGFHIETTVDSLGFTYGPNTFGPQPEIRSLDAIRPSLRDPECSGPDPVYAIAMDVGDVRDRSDLEGRMLLVGAVTYAAGQLGHEPVRSQGHVHAASSHSGWSPPELYEIWSGEAFVLMQEFAADDPGRCFAILAKPGDRVIVPPGWAHATISADPKQQVTFGAICDREYAFLYDEVRRRRGLAWYAIIGADGEVRWQPNSNYRYGPLEIRGPRDYSEFELAPGLPVYSQMQKNFDRFQWVSKPGLVSDRWKAFAP